MKPMFNINDDRRCSKEIKLNVVRRVEREIHHGCIVEKLWDQHNIIHHFIRFNYGKSLNQMHVMHLNNSLIQDFRGRNPYFFYYGQWTCQ